MAVEEPKAPQTPANGNPPSANPEIENWLREARTFPPDPEFTAQANAQADLYLEAETDYEAFWAKLARERISWFKDFDTTLEWDLPFARWFVGGEMNVSYNCVDRHVENGLGSKVAYHWIGEPGDTRTITYADLYREVQKTARALDALGIGKGDRVAIYMPMIPELPIAMLACARIGAPHTVVFGGFSAEALSGRINDAEAKLVITADGGWRRGKPAELKPAVDEALESTPSVHNVLVVRRLGDDAPNVNMVEGRDHWWHDIVDSQPPDCAPLPLDSEHMLYLLYTSGSTAKPKGIFHSSAGYLLGTAYSHWAIFDLKPDDVYWCAADIGWVTGHSYIVYGPLANAATGVMYEGTPGHARLGPLVADHRGLQGLDPVLRPDGDPGLHEAGRGAPAGPRPVVAAGPWLRRRADQPRGLALVPGAHRRREGAHRRHLVADRDGPDPRSRRCPASRPRSPAPPRSRSLGSRPTSSMGRASPCRSAAAATSS